VTKRSAAGEALEAARDDVVALSDRTSQPLLREYARRSQSALGTTCQREPAVRSISVETLLEPTAYKTPWGTAVSAFTELPCEDEHRGFGLGTICHAPAV
jgi:hypothetical protein